MSAPPAAVQPPSPLAARLALRHTQHQRQSQRPRSSKLHGAPIFTIDDDGPQSPPSPRASLSDDGHRPHLGPPNLGSAPQQHDKYGNTLSPTSLPEALEPEFEKERNSGDARSSTSVRAGSVGFDTTGARPGTLKGGPRRRSPVRQPDEQSNKDKHVAFPGVAGVGDSRGDSDSGGSSSTGTGKAAPKSAPKPLWRRVLDRVLDHPEMKWIKPKMTVADWKPVIRVAISMWIGYVLVLIHKTGVFLGMAAFLVLIVSCMIPPSQPFVQVLEVIFNLFFYLGLSWAWAVIGTAIAHATRVPDDPAKVAAAEAQFANVTNPTIKMVKITAEGTFLQARPAVVCSIWLSVGTGMLLWWKLRTAPSPATFPIVLACILLLVSFTSIALYPNAYYMMPFIVFKPIAIQAGIGLLCSIVIFPQSVSHLFRRRFAGVLNPLKEGMGEIEKLFSDASSMATFPVHHDDHDDQHKGYHQEGEHVTNFDEPVSDIEDKLEEWGDRSETIRQTLLKSATGMPPLQSLIRYLDVDISYERLSGDDLEKLFNIIASMQVRASGLSFFFNTLVRKIRRTHIDSSAFNASHVVSQGISRPGSRPPSRSGSRPASRMGSRADLQELRMGSLDTAAEALANADKNNVPLVEMPSTLSRPRTPSSQPVTPHESEDEGGGLDHDDLHDSLARKLHLHFHKSHSKSGLHSHKGSHSALHSGKGSGNQSGILNGHKGSHISLLESLRKSQQPVGVYESQRYMDVEHEDDHELERVVQQLELLSTGALPLVKALHRALTVAAEWSASSDRRRRATEREMGKAWGVLKVALAEFKEHRTEVIKPYAHLFDPTRPYPERNKIQHKGLYYSFVAQYHLIEFSDAVVDFLHTAVELDAKRPKRRWWYPKPFQLFHQFRKSVHKEEDTSEGNGGEGSMMEHDEDDEETGLLGETSKRNPDYGPFDSTWLNVLSRTSALPDLLFSRSAMYALKAGILVCLTTLPAFLASSCSFYYYNRGVWCSIMAMMTLQATAGDTFSSWLSRIMASFFGGILGLAMWYIGSGDGRGNPYGLAAVTAVIFPLACFYRLYYPPVLTTVVFTTSMCLVIGYSYLNGHLFQLTNASWGWDVAWLRFVCVVIGITAAWFFSYVPPVYSAKLAIRMSYGRSITSVGRILCLILSEANDPHNEVDASWNQKIRQDLLVARAKLVKLGARHATAKREYSLRGRWPAQSYAALLTTLEETMSLLAQFNHLLPQMDVRWRRALLARTRMADPLFLGDVFAVITMTSAALKSGSPLPQITSGPLIAEYHLNKYKGLDLPLDPAGGYEDAPSHVTAEVLESDEYMRYALGVSTVYALMSRLDSLVVTCKTLVGETFHISNMRFDGAAV